MFNPKHLLLLTLGVINLTVHFFIAENDFLLMMGTVFIGWAIAEDILSDMTIIKNTNITTEHLTFNCKKHEGHND